MGEEKKFEFKSEYKNSSNESIKFHVVRFSGEEGISKCYYFDIDVVVSDLEEKDIDGILTHPAKFSIFRDKYDKIEFCGVIEEFVQLRKYNEYVYYRIRLVPKLRYLANYLCSQVFLNKKPQDFMEVILEQAHIIKDDDYDFKIDTSPSDSLKYVPGIEREYVCQYNETHLNFFNRWLEFLGLYYFFEQQENKADDVTTRVIEKLIIADPAIVSNKDKEVKVRYQQEGSISEEVVTSFFCKRTRVPASVHLRNYYYGANDIKKPIDIQKDVNNNDTLLGTIYKYGEYFRSQKESEYLAKVRKEAIECRKKIYTGTSNSPLLRAGYFMKLQEHYDDDFNGSYLITSIYHEGSQTLYLSSGLSIEITDQEKKDYYRNEFQAIPETVQFRPECQAKKPKIYGMLNARIDAEGSGEYAELDEKGRYRVVLPFDVNKNGTNDYFDVENNRAKGKRSAPIRMMQPYGGPAKSTHSVGMHFPLRKGTEVLLSFIDGDIDRPVIAGAVPNENCPSVVTQDSETTLQLVSSGGNTLAFKDDEGKEAILFYTPMSNAYLHIGDPSALGDESLWFSSNIAPSDSDSDDSDHRKFTGDTSSNIVTADGSLNLVAAEGSINVAAAEGSINFLTGEGNINIGCLDFNATIGGLSFEYFLGLSCDIFAGGSLDIFIGEQFSFFLGASQDIYIGHKFELSLEFDWKSKGFDFTMTGKKTKLEMSVDNLIGQYNNLLADATKLAGCIEDLAGAHNNLVGNVNDLAGDFNKIVASHNKLVAQSTQLQGNKTEASGSKTKIQGNSTDIKANETKVKSNEIDVKNLKTGISALKIEV